MSARGKPGYKWKPQAGVETFVSMPSGWSTSGMSASMLRQTSGLQCCHFFFLSSASYVSDQPIFPLFSPLPPSSLFTIPCFLSGILSCTAMHPHAPTPWPRMASTLHFILGNLLTTDFCFSFPLFSCLFVDFCPLFLSSFSNSPSFSVCFFFFFYFLPCEVAVSSTSICIRCCSTCPHP